MNYKNNYFTVCHEFIYSWFLSYFSNFFSSLFSPISSYVCLLTCLFVVFFSVLLHSDFCTLFCHDVITIVFCLHGTFNICRTYDCTYIRALVLSLSEPSLFFALFTSYYLILIVFASLYSVCIILVVSTIQYSTFFILFVYSSLIKGANISVISFSFGNILVIKFLIK